MSFTVGRSYCPTLPASAFERVGNKRSASFRGGWSAVFAFLVVAAFRSAESDPPRVTVVRCVVRGRPSPREIA